jgi:hypothetical protein
MAAEPNSYGQLAEAYRAALAQARLADPGEHFPYKHDTVCDLLADRPAMGPGMPGGVDGAADRSREVDDYMSRAIADASRDYIDAQAAWLAEPSQVSRQAYEAARDRLVAARLDHRENRGDGFTIGAAARKAG